MLQYTAWSEYRFRISDRFDSLQTIQPPTRHRYDLANVELRDAGWRDLFSRCSLVALGPIIC